MFYHLPQLEERHSIVESTIFWIKLMCFKVLPKSLFEPTQLNQSISPNDPPFCIIRSHAYRLVKFLQCLLIHAFLKRIVPKQHCLFCDIFSCVYDAPIAVILIPKTEYSCFWRGVEATAHFRVKTIGTNVAPNSFTRSIAIA
jgi:hypothetical protein